MYIPLEDTQPATDQILWHTQRLYKFKAVQADSGVERQPASQPDGQRYYNQLHTLYDFVQPFEGTFFLEI